MHMITATYVATGEQPARHLEPDVISDILWSAANPGDGLEHICAKSGFQEVSLVLFHRAARASDAVAATARICRAALDQSPALAGWQLLRPARTRHPRDAAFSDRRHLAARGTSGRGTLFPAPSEATRIPLVKL
ncbi:hypothetical protein ACFVXW_34910 [Streptomyces sp. NPDC058251]|uniref:hypothetical protein n=1 Tax=unclassified Streptomyces TaxID=2593676 RepID=UPI00364AD22D